MGDNQHHCVSDFEKKNQIADFILIPQGVLRLLVFVCR